MTFDFRLSLLIILFLSFTLGCSSTKPTSKKQVVESLTSNNSVLQDSTLQQTVIQPGDELEILVWEHDDFNTQTVVSSSGTINMPLIGEMKVDGLTKQQLHNELRERLKEYIKGEIKLTISILNKNDNIITVLGSVNQPNNFEAVDDISVFALLSKAGGTTTDADLANVKIYRSSHNPHYQEVDMTTYFNEGELNPEVKVGPGDIVYVPPEKNLIRELSPFLRDIIMVFGLFRAVN